LYKVDFCTLKGVDAVVQAWRPNLPGLREVLHAEFAHHAYPPHTHDTWTVLMVDAGTVRYRLDRADHGVGGEMLSLLPPHVPHDGHGIGDGAYRKRVLYLEESVLDVGLIGRAVDRPAVVDAAALALVRHLHRCLRRPEERLEAESWLALVQEALQQALAAGNGGRQPSGSSVGHSRPGPALASAARGTGPDAHTLGRPVAEALRDLLDAALPGTITLEEAAGVLHAHPTHLLRSFSRRFGIAPHRYVTGRRVDLARRLLLEGRPAAEVAREAGFYDQSHLSRHFKAMLGVTPGGFGHRA
jgi:AraC-like DNA-binding protein